MILRIHRRDAEIAEGKFLCLVAERATRQNSSTLRVIKKFNFRIIILANNLAKIAVKESFLFPI
jgi:hypothetical protein